MLYLAGQKVVVDDDVEDGTVMMSAKTWFALEAKTREAILIKHGPDQFPSMPYGGYLPDGVNPAKVSR